MKASNHKLILFDKAVIIIATVLLLGIVLLAVGYFSDNKIMFYVSLLVILAAVFMGIQRLIFPSKS